VATRETADNLQATEDQHVTGTETLQVIVGSHFRLHFLKDGCTKAALVQII
jgi:hypothetical protein